MIALSPPAPPLSSTTSLEHRLSRHRSPAVRAYARPESAYAFLLISLCAFLLWVVSESLSHSNQCIILTMTFLCFLARFSPSSATVRIFLKIYGLVVVGAHTIAPTARGIGLPYFFCLLCGLVPIVVLMPKLSVAPAPRTRASAPTLCRSSGFLMLFTRVVHRSS